MSWTPIQSAQVAGGGSRPAVLQPAQSTAHVLSPLRARLDQTVTRDLLTPGPADNPTVTVGASNAVSAITGHAALGGYTALPNDRRVRLTGAAGPLVLKGSTFPLNLEYVAVGSISSTINTGLGFRIEVDFYGDRIELATFGNGIAPNIYVNGVKLAVGAVANDGGQHNILLDWSAGTGVKLRRLRFDYPSAGTLFGFYYAATHSLLAPGAVKPGAPRMIVTGDSWSDGTGTSDGISAWCYTAGQLLGIRDTWVAGLGGSGYLKDIAGATHIRPRIAADLVAHQPDIVVIATGSDDIGGGFTPAQIAAEATLAWQQIQGALPDCKLIVLGPWACPAAGGSPNYATSAPTDTALQAAAQAAGVPYISSIQEQWITGTGHIGGTNGSGSSDLLIGSDGIHPSQAGHDFVGYMAANRIASLL